MRMATTIIIPAYNEELSIGKVLDEIPKREGLEVIVVDNGSTDHTRREAEKRDVKVVYEPRRGYGSACLRGIQEASSETQIFVILDGDHSNHIEDLDLLLEPIERGEKDFVLGSRILGKAEPGSLLWNQKWGNWLATTLIRQLFSFSYTDMGPFRAIRKESLEKLEMQDPDYGWNAEMQVKAILHGLGIQEVPVRYRKRIGQSKISGTWKGTFLAGKKIILTIFRLYFQYRKSLKQERTR